MYDTKNDSVNPTTVKMLKIKAACVFFAKTPIEARGYWNTLWRGSTLIKCKSSVISDRKSKVHAITIRSRIDLSFLTCFLLMSNLTSNTLHNSSYVRKQTFVGR